MKIRFLIVPLVILWMNSAFAQKKDSTFFFKAELSVTNNGFSIIPAFTLGKPAAQLDMALGNKRLSFEPQFRYSLEGRPWSFIFIYRYKIINRSKFRLTLGGHIPGLNFSTRTITTNGIDHEASVARRFLAAEVIPTYLISEKVSVGFYGAFGRGFQIDAPRRSNYLAFRGNFTKINITKKIYFNFNPQLFYLTVDDLNGFYVNATTTIGIRNFPLSVSSIVNKAIETIIPTPDFDWNVSLIYTLDKKFVIR